MDLQIDQDLQFQQRDWAVQRVTLSLMAAFLALASAGLFGPGPLSHTQVRSVDDSLAVDYLRWGRRGREANLTVQVAPALVHEGRIRLEMPARYFSDMELRGVTPRPERVEADGDVLRFVFAAPRPQSPIDITFAIQGQGMGPVNADVRVRDAVVRFRQFLWP